MENELVNTKSIKYMNVCVPINHSVFEFSIKLLSCIIIKETAVLNDFLGKCDKKISPSELKNDLHWKSHPPLSGSHLLQKSFTFSCLTYHTIHSLI